MLPAIKAWNEEARCAQLRVIVVNACESDVHAEKLAGCVDFVIGHAGPVWDKHALTFSKTLYQFVCWGMSLARSFDMARSAAASPGYRIYAKEKDPSKFHLCPQPPKQSADFFGSDTPLGGSLSGSMERYTTVSGFMETYTDHLLQDAWVIHKRVGLGITFYK
jgi:hypothetical protein